MVNHVKYVISRASVVLRRSITPQAHPPHAPRLRRSRAAAPPQQVRITGILGSSSITQAVVHVLGCAAEPANHSRSDKGAAEPDVDREDDLAVHDLLGQHLADVHVPLHPVLLEPEAHSRTKAGFIPAETLVQNGTGGDNGTGGGTLTIQYSTRFSPVVKPHLGAFRPVT